MPHAEPPELRSFAYLMAALISAIIAAAAR